MNKFIVISDFHGAVGLISLAEEDADICKLREEFELIMYPGENPFAYDSLTQKEWLRKVRLREDCLVKKYGGSESGCDLVKEVYSPKTFIGWLVKEKGAKLWQHSEYCMAEFD